MRTKKSLSEKKLKKQLLKILDRNPNTIKERVIQEALDYNSIKEFFKDLLQHGCISGMVSSLIYYYDTESFFDTHYDEILCLKTEFEEATGQPMQIPYQLKNHLAWFGFEQTAFQIVIELGLEI